MQKSGQHTPKYTKNCFPCEGVQLVYQRPAPDPAGDNSAGGKRPAAVHHFPPGQPPPLTAAPALGRRPRPRIRRQGGGATFDSSFRLPKISVFFKPSVIRSDPSLFVSRICDLPFCVTISKNTLLFFDRIVNCGVKGYNCRNLNAYCSSTFFIYKIKSFGFRIF
jgi:hypothetical protein